MIKIINVIAQDDYTLVIELNNKHKIIYNMKPRLKGIRFCTLSEIGFFKSVRVENGDTLVWDEQCQLTLDEIFNNIERESS